MNSTRIAAEFSPTGLASDTRATGRRDRVDPQKLLNLIHRIKTASGTPVPTRLPVSTPQSAKAG